MEKRYNVKDYISCMPYVNKGKCIISYNDKNYIFPAVFCEGMSIIDEKLFEIIIRIIKEIYKVVEDYIEKNNYNDDHNIR